MNMDIPGLDVLRSKEFTSKIIESINKIIKEIELKFTLLWGF